MKKILIKILFIIGDLLGVNYIFNIINAKKMRILMYHGVTDEKLPAYCWTQIPKDTFKIQMRYIKSNLNVVELTSIFNKGHEKIKDKNNIAVITFDDGYYNIYNEAWPILKEMKVPATVFVVTGLSQSRSLIWTDLVYNILIKRYDYAIDLSRFNLGKLPAVDNCLEREPIIDDLKMTLKSYPNSDRKAVIDYLVEKYPLTEKEFIQSFKVMTAEQIKEMSECAGITIASHSHFHPIFSTLSPEEQFQDIALSKKQLALWKIPESGLFAYPNGRPEDFNEATISALKGNNINAAVTTIDSLTDSYDDSFHIKRINLSADIDIWEFKARISGFYYFILNIYNRLWH